MRWSTPHYVAAAIKASLIAIACVQGAAQAEVKPVQVGETVVSSESVTEVESISRN